MVNNSQDLAEDVGQAAQQETTSTTETLTLAVVGETK